MGTLRLSLRSNGQLTPIATIEWPAHLDTDAHTFIRDNLLTERCGSPRAAQKLLDAGVLPAADRARFLAEKTFFPPEPPQQLAIEMDLEDFVAEFAVGLRALRAAPPEADLLITLSASAPPAAGR